MGKKDKKGDTSASSEEEYVVEKVLDKRTVKGKVGGQFFHFCILVTLHAFCMLCTFSICSFELFSCCGNNLKFLKITI